MKLIKLLNYCLLFLFIIFSSNLYSETIESIEISGNKRISDETIMSFLPVNVNDTISTSDINEITKDLYSTNFFKNVALKFENNFLIVNVIENPIIQSIFYNGIESKTLLDFVLVGTNLKERSSFVETYAQDDISKIQTNLKKKGYFFSYIKTKVENLEENKINLTFDFELGEKAKISKISFLGDKVYKDSKLRSVILSEEYKFWKFISGKKFLNEELVEFDKKLLKNFYLNNGYYESNITSSFAKLIDKNEFELIFNISAGKKFFFDNLKIELPLNYDAKNFTRLKKTFIKLKNKPYSINAIEKIVKDIDLLILNEEFESVKINVEEKINNNLLNLTFFVEETDKTIIERINILGNNVTRENVIRNQLEIDEGDLFNEILYNKSLNNIQSLNFFKVVEGDIAIDDNTGDKIINISVEEKATGEIGASAGVGTSGNSIGFFVKENNYLGRGINVDTNMVLSDDSIKGIISIINPNFNDTDKLIYGSLEAVEIDKLKSFGYKTNRTGFSYGTRFELLDDFNFGLGNKNFYQKIETDHTASNLQQRQEGDYWDSFLTLDFIYDKRNQKFKTTDGFRSFYSLDLPFISETNTIVNSYDFKIFKELYENNISALSIYVKTSNSLSNDEIKLTERNFLPSNKLRGFKAGAVGPKDGTDYIGGNYASSINLSSTLPQILKDNQNIDFSIFFDAGNVWGVDYDSSLNETNKIRSSAGLGVDWFTPIGPLNFTLAQPITKYATDSTETFRFNLGTTF